MNSMMKLALFGMIYLRAASAASASYRKLTCHSYVILLHEMAGRLLASIPDFERISQVYLL